MDRVSHPQAARKLPSIRAILVWLVVATLLPGIAGSAVILYLNYRSERDQLERNTLQTARALVQAVDAELSKAQGIAQTLAQSPYLATQDFAAFHRQARETVEATGAGRNSVLSDAAGQQIINTLRPYPGPLPRHGNPEQLRRVFDSAKPAISDVYIGGVLKRPVMSVDVPVMLDGKVKFCLSIGLFPEQMAKLLSTLRRADDWPVAVFDSQGVVAARTHFPEKFVGQKAVPAVVKGLADIGEGTVETRTLEGTASVVVFSRSAWSGWAVGIGIPIEEFAAPLRKRFLLLTTAIFVLSVASLVMAARLAGRIAGAIRDLSAPALALGAGNQIVLPPARLRETAEVADAIGTAGSLLEHRTRELKNANQELEDFSYAISHDLTTPLRAVAGYSRIVEEESGACLNEEAKSLLARMRSSTARMGKLIDSLVDFMQLARRKLHPAEVDLATLARAVFQRCLEAQPERLVRLEIGDLPPAWGDREMLARVLENLIGNALKFIPAQADGRIVIAGETAKNETIYRITDNGVGFDMRYAGKLFRAFEHLHAPGEFEGLGAGLAIVKRIVGRHGGRVWADGRPDAGATLYFALPSKPASAAKP